MGYSPALTSFDRHRVFFFSPSQRPLYPYFRYNLYIPHTALFRFLILYFRYKLYKHSHRKPCVRYFLKNSQIFSTRLIFKQLLQLLQNLSRTYSIGHQLLNRLFQFRFLRFLSFRSIKRSLLLFQFTQLNIQLLQLCLLRFQIGFDIGKVFFEGCVVLGT